MKYKNVEPKFNGVYSRNNLPEEKDGAYVINLDGNKPIETPWIALHINGDNVTYFDSFGVELTPKKIKKYMGNKNTNIRFNNVRIHSYWTYWFHVER